VSAKKSGLQGLAVAVSIAIIVIGAIVEFAPALLLSTASSNQVTTVGPQGSGWSAYCSPANFPGSSAAAGVYPVGPGTTPPLGCVPNQQQINLQLQDVYNPSANLGAGYSCVFYWNSGTPAAFTVLGQGYHVTGGTWTLGTTVRSSSGVCAPPSWAVATGTQVVVKVCNDTTPSSCAAGDFSSQRTVEYFPLPSNAPYGLGLGSVPFNLGNGYSTTISLIMIAGQNPTGSNSGYNTATPILLDERYQNGTDFTSANSCFVNTGANACDKPTSTSRGKFSMTWGLTQGGAGTAPANPQGSGYQSSTMVDTAGVTARGDLRLILSVEIKATTGSDMCQITGPLFGATATIVQKSTSATDIFYLYTLNESALTKTTDVSGNTLNPGSIQTGVQLDCGPVFNGSGDVVTITPIVYGYFALQYFQSYQGTVLNPEASALTQSAVITIRT